MIVATIVAPGQIEVDVLNVNESNLNFSGVMAHLILQLILVYVQILSI